MAETLVNKNQAGEGLWTADNLVAGSGISIQQVPQPVIDSNTLGVWHFENNLDNAVSGSSYTIATSSQGGLGFNYSAEKKKFGEYSATITGSTVGYYFFPASTPLNSFDNFTIDFWVQTGPSTWGSNYYHRYYIPGTSANQNCVRVEVGSSQIQVLAWTGASQIIKSCVPSTWVHIAIELYQSKLNVYLNGEKISSSDVGYSPLTFAVNPQGLSMQLDELRLSNVARYQGNNFTPYTVPYSASAGPAQYAINNTKADPDLSNYATQSDISGMLKNTATGTDSLTIKGIASSRPYDTNIGVSSIISSGGYGTAVGYGATGYTGSVVIGAQALATDANSVTIGRNAVTNSQSVAIGGTANYSTATTESGAYSIAVGYNAKATASNAIQLGSGKNSTANTFKVFNTTVVDASGKIPAANLDTAIPDVSTKADTDLANVNSLGKSTSASWAMPSGTYIDLTLGASGTTYTAPSSGWFFIAKAASLDSQYLDIEYTQSGTVIINNSRNSVNNGEVIRVLTPVLKGQNVKISYSLGGATSYFRFVYAEGSKSEAN